MLGRFCAVAAACGAAAAGSADPFAPGKYAVAETSGKTPSDTKWSYNVWSPDAEGTFPVVVFVTGGGGIAPASTYSNVSAAVAAKGAVFVGLWRLAAPAPKKDAEYLANALPWLQANLKLKATADWEQLTLAGHSAGNHVFCDYLQTQCGPAKAAVMIDPVDGYDPFGVVKNYCITPGQKVKFSVPALLLRTGLDPVAKSVVACAPDRISNQRFYDAWAGPVWEANATGYGHLDVNDAGISGMGGLLCATDKLPKDVYHRQVAGLVSAFLRMVFAGDAAAEQVLVSAGGMPVDTLAQHDYNGHKAPFAGSCTHQ
eukprot:TRINITY_DN33426_c0_g1_i1.p1 TRINITY_DN33426_c0_g1~~TRINITY_DN33426_c0_g1_i1.p1  ORF type:complete len:314 (+),score=122.47 TRINITY_DN33426_c0_g1_i1:65-1006(+)